jgi:hypothetical protein
MARFARLRGFGRTQLAELVRTLPVRELLPLIAAIASLFAVLGPVMDVLNGGRQPTAATVIYTIFSATIAIGYALGTMRRNLPLFWSAVAVQAAWIVLRRLGVVHDPALLGVETAPSHLTFDGSAVLILMVVSYTCFLWFLNGAAARYLRVSAEIDLAHQIHQVLVPAVNRTAGGFEFAGFSIPSGAVGGDLVDVVPLPSSSSGEWFAYIADVSGHGVSSGVVMGMFKSALRMRLLHGGPLASLLDDLNGVLLPLRSGSMFVTLACVRAAGPGALDFAVAGHLPILRVRNAAVEELTTPQIPIGMFEDYRFTASTLEMSSRDLLVLLTDGLIEVFDAKDRELGLHAIKALLPAAAGRPLQEIADAIVAKARAHGAQMDDQTVLLIRRT